MGLRDLLDDTMEGIREGLGGKVLGGACPECSSELRVRNASTVECTSCDYTAEIRDPR